MVNNNNINNNKNKINKTTTTETVTRPPQSPFVKPVVEGHWKWVNWWRGYQYFTPDVTSGPEIKKRKNPLGGEIWGPYQKNYVKSFFGQIIHYPPEFVDNVRILCNCYEIRKYMSDSQGRKVGLVEDATIFSRSAPACWTDRDLSIGQMFVSGNNILTYDVYVNYPGFFLEKFLGGSRSRRRLKRNGRKTKKLKKSTASDK